MSDQINERVQRLEAAGWTLRFDLRQDGWWDANATRGNEFCHAVGESYQLVFEQLYKELTGRHDANNNQEPTP